MQGRVRGAAHACQRRGGLCLVVSNSGRIRRKEKGPCGVRWVGSTRVSAARLLRPALWPLLFSFLIPFLFSSARSAVLILYRTIYLYASLSPFLSVINTSID